MNMSSANNLTILNFLSTKSLIYNKKYSGPRTDPWGTPAVVFLNSKYEVPIKTRGFLFSE